MMYLLLTAFESFSVYSEAALGLFAWLHRLLTGARGTEDDVVSVTDLPAATGPNRMRLQSPDPPVEPIESQTIREHMARFIKQ